MFDQAFRYKTWADLRTLEAVESIDQLAYAEGYAFALQQLNHMVIVEELFASRLTNKPQPHQSTNTPDVPGLGELKQRLVASNNWFRGYVADAVERDRPVRFVFADGKQGMMKVEEILFHVVNHGTYHRGNIARALDQASVPHPVDGYGVFIHEKEPERRDM